MKALAPTLLLLCTLAAGAPARAADVLAVIDDDVILRTGGGTQVVSDPALAEKVVNDRAQTKYGVLPWIWRLDVFEKQVLQPLIAAASRRVVYAAGVDRGSLLNATENGPSSFGGLISQVRRRGVETSVLSSKRPFAETLSELESQLGLVLRRREHDPNDTVPWTSFESDTVIDEHGHDTYPVGAHFTFELPNGAKATMHRHWYTTKSSAKQAAADIRQAEPDARVLVGGHQVIVLRGWNATDLAAMEPWSQQGRVVFPTAATPSSGGIVGGFAPQTP